MLNNNLEGIVMFVVVLAFIIIATILAVIGTGFEIFSYCKKRI